MKKTLILAVICVMTVGAAFGQNRPQPIPNSQSMSFAGPANWTPGTSVSLDVSLTFSPYQSVGLSYWLEVPMAVAPFLTIASEVYLPTGWSDPNQTGSNTPFNSTTGARATYNSENRDLGSTSTQDANNNFDQIRDAGTIMINTLNFNLALGAPAGTYTMYSTSNNPRISEVTSYPDFSDNNIIPPGMFVFTIVPEPSTFALLGLAAVGSGVLAYRRRKANR